MTVMTLAFHRFALSLHRQQTKITGDRPLVLCQHKSGHWRVSVACPQAQRAGIRRGMTIHEVQRLLKDVTHQPLDPLLLRQAQQEVLQVLQGFAPRIEPLALGRFALDLQGLQQLYPRPQQAALRLRDTLYQRLQLFPELAVTRNKLVGTIAVEEAHMRQQPLLEVPHGNEASFLAPLANHRLPDWQFPMVREQLTLLNLQRIQHIQGIPKALFCQALGGAVAPRLHDHAFGIDWYPVTPPAEQRSISAHHCFTPPSNDWQTLLGISRQLLQTLGFTLRQRHLGTVQLDAFLLFRDGVSRQKQMTLPPTQDDAGLLHHYRQLFPKLWDRRQAVQWLQVTLSRLAPFEQQLHLFDNDERPRALQHCLDQIRHRFGHQALGYVQA
jgi:nucleotidyltransferase/DNA polymerase involved in DNA repair